MLLQTSTSQYLYRLDPNLGLCRSMHLSCVQLLTIYTEDTQCVLCSPEVLQMSISAENLNFINLSYSLVSLFYIHYS